MSLSITKDCFPPADACHNCERKDSNAVREKGAAVKDYKRCSGCHLLTYCCSGCHLLTYCDKDCQREHWMKVHKSHCKFLSGKAPVSNSAHNAATCARCIEGRESSATQLRSENSHKTVCFIEEVTIAMNKALSHVFKFHEGKKGHCSLEFPCQLPFPLGEVSGIYVEIASTRLDAMLAHTLKILKAMFIKAQEENHRSALSQLWNYIICERSNWWFDILIRGKPSYRARKYLSDQVDNLRPIYGPSNPWWKSLKFTVDFVVKTNWYLMSNFNDPDSMEDQRFQKYKLAYDYGKSQIQNQAIMYEMKLWPNFMLWPELVNGSLAFLLPPETQCQSCYAELSGEVAVTVYEVNSETLPCLLSDVGDNGALMTCCPVTKNPNCRKDCLFKNVKDRMCSHEDQRKELLKETELFGIESRDCDLCLKLSLSSHRCSACLTVQYCSTVCQKIDLDFHQTVCATWAKDKSRRIKGKEKQKDHFKSVFAKQ